VKLSSNREKKSPNTNWRLPNSTQDLRRDWNWNNSLKHHLKRLGISRDRFKVKIRRKKILIFFYLYSFKINRAD
jgi:hypothetical protein